MWSSDRRTARSRQTSTPCRVLVVDDSAFMRRLVSDLIGECPEFMVVGTARDGEHALEQVRLLDPDVVTLDIEMPGQDGLTALQHIMRLAPRPVVMLSAGGGSPGADAAIRSLELGAVEFVTKPSGTISLDLDNVRQPLLEALRAAASMNRAVLKERTATVSRGLARDAISAAAGKRTAGDARGEDSATRHQSLAASSVVCIASSTGGPAALAHIIPALPRFTNTAVLVAQHMPPGFTQSLARRLDNASRLCVREAVSNEPIVSGHVYIAPGGKHLLVRASADGSAHLVLDDGPTVWGVRPAADLLFASAAVMFGDRCTGVVLTGMGCDGAEGARVVRAHGGRAFAQNAESCVVDGMPSAARRGGCTAVPLSEMAAVVITSAMHAPDARARRTTPLATAR